MKPIYRYPKIDDLVFPWLGPTRTSELAGAVVTDEQVNKLQAYWGMPRRIRIDFNTTTVGNCDICGEQSDALLSLMTTKNYGANYAMWQHPLTPYRVPLKEGGEFYSVKPQPGGLIWRDWLGLIETGKSENNTELPALVVKLFNASSLKQAKVGLWGFGYDFDNMKRAVGTNTISRCCSIKKKVRYRSCGWLRKQLHGF